MRIVSERLGNVLDVSDWFGARKVASGRYVVEGDDGGLPSGNASREEWAAAADRLGVNYSDEDGRNDIRDRVS